MSDCKCAELERRIFLLECIALGPSYVTDYIRDRYDGSKHESQLLSRHATVLGRLYLRKKLNVELHYTPIGGIEDLSFPDKLEAVREGLLTLPEIVQACKNLDVLDAAMILGASDVRRRSTGN